MAHDVQALFVDDGSLLDQNRVLKKDIYRENTWIFTDYETAERLAKFFARNGYSPRDRNIAQIRPRDFPNDPVAAEESLIEGRTPALLNGGVSALLKNPNQNAVPGLKKVTHWKLARNTPFPAGISVVSDHDQHVLLSVQPGTEVVVTNEVGQQNSQRFHIPLIAALPWMPYESRSNEDDGDGASNCVNELMKKKLTFLQSVQQVINELQSLQASIETNVHNCAVVKTVGNSVTIVSTILLFTPLFPVGIGGLATGAVTTIGTTVIGSKLKSEEVKAVERVISIESEALQEYSKASLMVAAQLPAWFAVANITTFFNPATVELAKGGFEIARSFSSSSLSSAASSAEATGVALGATTAVKLLGVLAIAVNILDIVATWTVSDSTVNAIKDQIQERKALMEKEETDLHVFFFNSIPA